MAKKKVSKKNTAPRPANIVVLKVALRGQKSIWRRIALRAEQTLGDLHEAIFDAFDRFEEHLYSFYFPKPGSKGRSRERDAVEFACPYACEDPGPFADELPNNAANTTLSSLNLQVKQEFSYLFDYGDSWWHDITVEKSEGVRCDEAELPCVIESRGKSPAQYPDFNDDEDE